MRPDAICAHEALTTVVRALESEIAVGSFSLPNQISATQKSKKT